MDNSSAGYTAGLDGEEEEGERIVENGKREWERGRRRKRWRTASEFQLICRCDLEDSLAKDEISPSLSRLPRGRLL
jgi:hypothetical protein